MWRRCAEGTICDRPVVFARPSGNYDLNGVLDVCDINALSAAARTGANDLAFALNADQLVNGEDRAVWVRTFQKTWFGDADLNGPCESNDLVAVFQAGQYEEDVALNSTCDTGDWDGNGDFESDDMITAFQDGGHEQGVRAAVGAVPEPASWPLLALGVLLAVGCFRIGPARRNGGIEPPKAMIAGVVSVLWTFWPTDFASAAFWRIKPCAPSTESGSRPPSSSYPAAARSAACIAADVAVICASLENPIRLIGRR